jgi:hypothetical protein
VIRGGKKMSTRALVPSRRLAAAVILSLLAGLLAVPVVASADDTVNRSYRAEASAPACTNPDGTLRVRVTLRNTSATQQLGSANLTFPAGLGDLSSVSRDDVTVAPPGRGTISRPEWSGRTLELRNLNAAAGATVTVYVTVKPTAHGAYELGVVAKQANNFSGTGNDLLLLGDPPTVVVGDCQFEEVCEPGSCAYEETNTEGTLSISLSGTTGPDGGGFAATFGVATGDCVDPTGSFHRLPDSVELLGVGFLPPKLVVFRIDKEYDQRQPNNGVAFYQICAEPLDDTAPFTDRFGNPVEFGGANPRGFLPDCTGPNDYPCVQSREKEDGFPVITVRWGSRKMLQ